MHPTSSTSHRVSLWEWAQTALLALALAWTTLGRGGYPPSVAVVGGALTVALVAVHGLARALARPGEWAPLHPAGWLPLPFLVYAAIHAQWLSPVPWLGWRDVWGWAQMAAVFWVVLNGVRSSRPQRALFGVLVLLGLAGVVLACYQTFVAPGWQILGGRRPEAFVGRGSGSFGVPNSFAAYLLLLLPAVAALALRRSATATRRIWWGWVSLVLALGLALTVSRGAWLALALALAAAPLLLWRVRWRRRVAAALAVAAGLAAVGAGLYAGSAVVRQRFAQAAAEAGERTRPIMWRGAWQLFRSAPLLGTGAGSYNVLFERHRPERFPDEPLYAHNDYLNTLADYGLVGCLLLAGAAGVVAVRSWRGGTEAGRARRRDALDSPTVQAGLAVGLLAFALQLGLEFHFKIPALALAWAVVVGLVASRRWPAPAAERPARRWAGGAVAVAVVAGWAVFVFPMQRGEAWRVEGRTEIDRLAGTPSDPAAYRPALARARAALERATALAPGNGQAWADLAYAAALWSHVEEARGAELGRAAEAAATRALTCSPVVFEFWVRRGSARDLQGRWTEAGDDFAAALRLAPANANAWYYYAEHLTRMPRGREAAEGALAFCLRLDPWNPPGVALRQRLATSPQRP